MKDAYGLASLCFAAVCEALFGEDERKAIELL